MLTSPGKDFGENVELSDDGGRLAISTGQPSEGNFDLNVYRRIEEKWVRVGQNLPMASFSFGGDGLTVTLERSSEVRGDFQNLVQAKRQLDMIFFFDKT